MAADPSRSDSGIEVEADNIGPLPAGDPLRSYFPVGTSIIEHREGVDVRRPGSREVLHYQKAVPNCASAWKDDTKPFVQDIIITGEVGALTHLSLALNTCPYHVIPIQGHSAWGQFSLMGRVRPCDGFVSLCKEYVRYFHNPIHRCANIMKSCYPCLTHIHSRTEIGGNGYTVVTSSGTPMGSWLVGGATR